MKLETQEIKGIKLRILTAETGKVFKQKNGNDIYGNLLYLGVEDSPTNYEEIIKKEELENAGDN